MIKFKLKLIQNCTILDLGVVNTYWFQLSFHSIYYSLRNDSWSLGLIDKSKVISKPSVSTVRIIHILFYNILLSKVYLPIWVTFLSVILWKKWDLLDNKQDKPIMYWKNRANFNLNFWQVNNFFAHTTFRNKSFWTELISINYDFVSLKFWKRFC